MAQGTSLTLPQSSPLMKLPMRPQNRPCGTSGAMKSETSRKDFLRVRAKYQKAQSTPSRPPWKDMPPFQMRRISPGSSM